MKNRAKEISKKVIKLSGVNVFKNTRQTEYCEARSLLNFILKRYEKMTLFEIRDFYAENGRSQNHATIIHSIKNFDIFKNYKSELLDWLHIITTDFDTNNNDAKRELIKTKVKYISNEDVEKISKTVDKMYQKQLKAVVTKC